MNFAGKRVLSHSPTFQTIVVQTRLPTIGMTGSENPPGKPRPRVLPACEINGISEIWDTLANNSNLHSALSLPAG